MLILDRKPGEYVTLKIPPSNKERLVTVMVTKIRPYSAKVGIEADPDVSINRPDMKKPKQQEAT